MILFIHQSFMGAPQERRCFSWGMRNPQHSSWQDSGLDGYSWSVVYTRENCFHPASYAHEQNLASISKTLDSGSNLSPVDYIR